MTPTLSSVNQAKAVFASAAQSAMLVASSQRAMLAQSMRKCRCAAEALLDRYTRNPSTRVTIPMRNMGIACTLMKYVEAAAMDAFTSRGPGRPGGDPLQ